MDQGYCEAKEEILEVCQEIGDVLTQHSELLFYPVGMNLESRMLWLDLYVREPRKWPTAAHHFMTEEEGKYDGANPFYSIDGQPRVSYSGHAWVRLNIPYGSDTSVALNICTMYGSHDDAEMGLSELYQLFGTRNGMQPLDVFKHYSRRV